MTGTVEALPLPPPVVTHTVTLSMNPQEFRILRTIACLNVSIPIEAAKYDAVLPVNHDEVMMFLAALQRTVGRLRDPLP